MKSAQKNRKTLGWLLAFLLLLPSALRMEHVYHFHAQEDGGLVHHDCSTCAVCRFAFSLFTGNDVFESEVLPQYVEYEIWVFDSPVTVSFPFSYHLRAPPAAA
jgi:hypothetical protein